MWHNTNRVRRPARVIRRAQKRARKLTSAIVWRGVSSFDGITPIVAIITGLDGSSRNPKTGKMAHLWFLVADMTPRQAVQTGADRAICWQCGLRGNGCYVVIENAPRAIYAKFAAGGYRDIDPAVINAHLIQKRLPLRLGAYGDPAAVPLPLIHTLTTGLVAHTGYTHAWRNRPDLAPYVMASVDNPIELSYATALGFRTFRTRAPEQELAAGELTCPASDEAGHRTTCAECTLCDGMTEGDRRRSIAIIAHGSTKTHALTFIRAIA